MYDYNASYLNEQATLLEEFHKIQRYLIEHPLYQIYQSSADYVAGVNEYYINEVSVREGGTLSVGDVVLFSNVYYGVITGINEGTEMFTIAQGISFRGATGETGPRGGVGPRGLPGRDGTNGTNGTNGLNGIDGKNGLSIYLYDGALNDTLTTAYVAQINVPTGYTVKTGDILFSTLETSYGAMSLVTSDAVDFSTVVSIDYIGQLAGASGGKVIRDIDGNIPASALENISVSVGTATNGVTYIRAQMKGEVTYDDNTYDTINFFIDLPIKAGDGITIETQPLGGSSPNAPIEVGDTIDKLYFNTSVTPDLLQVEYTEGEPTALILCNHAGVFVYDMATLTGGAVNAYCIIAQLGDGRMPIVYSTEPFDFEGLVATQGWNIDQLTWTDEAVTEVNQQDLWSSYISKEPFTSGGTGNKQLVISASGGGGGTTLNKYSLDLYTGNASRITLLNNIVKNAKRVVANIFVSISSTTYRFPLTFGNAYDTGVTISGVRCRANAIDTLYWETSSDDGYVCNATGTSELVPTFHTITFGTSQHRIYLTYWNETEITA